MMNSSDIIEAVESFYGYEIDWNTRARIHVEPKQIVTYLVHKVFELKPALVASNLNIGRCITYYNIDTVQALLLDKQFQIKYRSLFEKFGFDIVDYGFDIKN